MRDKCIKLIQQYQLKLNDNDITFSFYLQYARGYLYMII